MRNIEYIEIRDGVQYQVECEYCGCPSVPGEHYVYDHDTDRFFCDESCLVKYELID